MSNVHTLHTSTTGENKGENFLIALPVPTSGYRGYRDECINQLKDRCDDYKSEIERLNKIEAAEDIKWLNRRIEENQIKIIDDEKAFCKELSWSMKKLYDQIKSLGLLETPANNTEKNKKQKTALEPGKEFTYIKLKQSNSEFCHVCEREQPLVRVCTKCGRKCFYQCSVNLIYQQLARCWNTAVTNPMEGQEWLCHYCNQLKEKKIKDNETNEKLKEFYGRGKPNYTRCGMDTACKSGGQHVTEEWKLVCNTCGKPRPLTRACFGCHNWFTTPPPQDFNKKPVTVFSIFFCVKCKKDVGDEVAEFDNFITKMTNDEKLE